MFPLSERQFCLASTFWEKTIPEVVFWSVNEKWAYPEEEQKGQSKVAYTVRKFYPTCMNIKKNS